ncbi:hypothetical protein NXH76_00705 [Blautia schinkii]|nr:hypothetical protein [Blautia schinkii]
MGTSFENIHIFTKDNEVPAVQSLKCRVIRLAENWLTLFPEDGWRFCEGNKLAGRLSGELSFPVLWVSYFDDDMAELVVYQGRKKVCSYQTDNCGHTYLQKSKVWKSVLELTETEEKALHEISKCAESPGEAFELLSHIIGVPLFQAVFPDFADAKVPVPYCRQPDWTEKWLGERRALNRVKNHTRMKLCCELQGVHAPVEDDREYGIIRICPPNGEGSFVYNHICCYMIQNEAFVQVYDYRYPEELFHEEDKSLRLDYYHKDIMILDINAFGNGDGQLFWDKYIDELECLISDKHQLKSHPLARKPHPANMLETSDGNFQYFCEERSLPERVPALVKKQLDQTECQAYLYESDEGQEWFWGFGQVSLQIVEKQIVLVTQKIYYGHTGKIGNNIRFFDENLNLLREEEFTTYKEQEHMNDRFVYSTENDTIYFNGCSCHLGSHKVSRCAAPVNGNAIVIDRRKNIILISGASTVIVLNPALQLLSRHKLKGGIYDVYQNDAGNYCFITVDENVYNWNRPSGKAAVRIYEMSYPEGAGL